MDSVFITKYKTYHMKTGTYVCNKFGLAELAALYFEELGCHTPCSALDVGCGVGPLSIFLADRFGCKVQSVDINESACRFCEDNISKYNLENLISVSAVDFSKFDEVHPNKYFDLIISNPPVDANIADDIIREYADNDFSSMDDASFAYVTNSWHDRYGLDLTDHIFQYANRHLNTGGAVVLVFCNIECGSIEYITEKAFRRNFSLAQSIHSKITPESIGVENFIKTDISAYILKFNRSE